MRSNERIRRRNIGDSEVQASRQPGARSKRLLTHPAAGDNFGGGQPALNGDGGKRGYICGGSRKMYGAHSTALSFVNSNERTELHGVTLHDRTEVLSYIE